MPADLAPLAAPEPPSRHPWAWLLRRVFAADVTACPVDGCGGRMRVVEIATKPSDIARVLAEGGVPRSRAPPPVRPPRRGQLSLALAELRFAAVQCTPPSSKGAQRRATNRRPLSGAW